MDFNRFLNRYPWLWMAWMEVDCNLKKLEIFFFIARHKTSYITSYITSHNDKNLHAYLLTCNQNLHYLTTSLT